MPTDVYKNSNIYSIVAEGEIAELLSKFNTQYVMDVIDSNIRNRFAFNPSLLNPNIVNSYELNFKGMINNFPDDGENIISIRQETYLTIINKICNSFNLQYVGDNPDCYVLAWNMYDIFVSGFSRNIINFFAKYIYTYRAEIYNNMGLEKYKKSKDSTINYVRKVFEDSKYIDVIISKIREVIYYISGFDIDFYTFLSFNYPKAMCDFIYNNIAPMDNLFKNEICKVINVPSILTEIRIKLQSLLMQESEAQQQQSPIESEEEPDEGDMEDDDI